MRISGLQKCSFVDYPGKLAAVVFTPGCNMNCAYCHNHQLIDSGECEKPSEYSPSDVLDFLESRRGLLDGVVVTGGEPTLQDGLATFIAAVRELGFAVKLDTNGTNPDMLGELVDEKLVDFVAMDIKAPVNRYHEISRWRGDIRRIKDSVSILMQDRVDYEFRTTFSPELSMADIVSISLWIRGAKNYRLQQYRVVENSPAAVELGEPHSEQYFRETLRMIDPGLRNQGIYIPSGKSGETAPRRIKKAIQIAGV